MIKIIRTAVACALLASALPLKAQRKPNIVLIISDDHAYQAIGAYGGKNARTPNIDRLAREGVKFNRAYVTNSICGPSRAVILTGKHSHRNGFKDNEHSRFDGSQNTFIKELGKAGYNTAWIGKWHLETRPQGFSYWQILPGQGAYYNPDFLMMDGSRKQFDGYVSNVIEDEAEKWLNARDTSQPFCLVIGHKATHRTWIPDTTDMGAFENTNFELPHNFFDKYEGREAARVQEMSISESMRMGYDLKMFGDSAEANREGSIKRMNPAQRAKFDAFYNPIAEGLKTVRFTAEGFAQWKFQRYMRDYMSTALSLDRNIGRTLDYLDQHGLSENTIVIYMSDQGFYLGEHGWFDKRFMYEESFRTPMVMRYPGKVKPNSANNDFVMNLDIAPTLLDAAGVKAPDDMQGKSFLPVLARKEKARKTMYYHYYENGEHAVSPHFGVRNERYKLIRFYTRVNGWELYDLKKDPSEMTNLINSKKHGKIKKKMMAELQAEIGKYGDTDAMAIMRKDL